ncbi:MAG TPA: hypothetical protein VLJ59_16595 [Mycobacteriales bacterium]|nr:hypothetical protein [Mycobacteriales bacterium]
MAKATPCARTASPRTSRTGRPPPVTHQALDKLPDSQPLAHLRQTLVAVGALPERDEIMVRLEAFLTGLLAAQHDTDRRNLLHRYLIWQPQSGQPHVWHTWNVGFSPRHQAFARAAALAVVGAVGAVSAVVAGFTQTPTLSQLAWLPIACLAAGGLAGAGYIDTDKFSLDVKKTRCRPIEAFEKVFRRSR